MNKYFFIWFLIFDIVCTFALITNFHGTRDIARVFLFTGITGTIISLWVEDNVEEKKDENTNT